VAHLSTPSRVIGHMFGKFSIALIRRSAVGNLINNVEAGFAGT
jgi:hypothetical protein